MSRLIGQHGARGATLAAAAALALAGCSILSGGDGGSPSPAESSTSTAPSRDLSRAGRELTTAEAKAMLPSPPSGYAAQAEEEVTHVATTDPEVCADVIRRGEKGVIADAQRTADVDAFYFTRATSVEAYEAYSFTLHSHSEPVSSALLGTAGEALGQCSAFSLTGENDSGNVDDRYLAESLAVRNIGEQTLAVRLTTFVKVDGKVHRIYNDRLSFRVGHNVVDVAHTTYDEDASTEQVQEYAEEILDALGS